VRPLSTALIKRKDIQVSEFDSVYRKFEVVSSSSTSIKDAIQNAISRSNSTIDHAQWLEITRTIGHVVDGKVVHYQVHMHIGFLMEDAT
jgi:flavin-binding protein dodecin